MMRKIIGYLTALTFALALTTTALAGDCCAKAAKNAKKGKTCVACEKAQCCKDAVKAVGDKAKACKQCAKKSKSKA